MGSTDPLIESALENYSLKNNEETQHLMNDPIFQGRIEGTQIKGTSCVNQILVIGFERKYGGKIYGKQVSLGNFVRNRR